MKPVVLQNHWLQDHWLQDHWLLDHWSSFSKILVQATARFSFCEGFGLSRFSFLRVVGFKDYGFFQGFMIRGF
jgi:hypothetical protein